MAPRESIVLAHSRGESAVWERLSHALACAHLTHVRGVGESEECVTCSRSREPLNLEHTLSRGEAASAVEEQNSCHHSCSRRRRGSRSSRRRRDLVTPCSRSMRGEVAIACQSGAHRQSACARVNRVARRRSPVNVHHVRTHDTSAASTIHQRGPPTRGLASAHTPVPPSLRVTADWRRARSRQQRLTATAHARGIARPRQRPLAWPHTSG